MKKSPFDERAGWISVVIGLKLLDDLLGKFGGFRNYINGNARFQQVPCDFLRLLPCRAVFPIRLVNVLHHVAEHVSGTKITQFYLVLQYPEHGIGGNAGNEKSPGLGCPGAGKSGCAIVRVVASSRLAAPAPRQSAPGRVLCPSGR